MCISHVPILLTVLPDRSNINRVRDDSAVFIIEVLTIGIRRNWLQKVCGVVVIKEYAKHEPAFLHNGVIHHDLGEGVVLRLVVLLVGLGGLVALARLAHV